MKGFRTDEKTVIQILARLDPLQIEGVKQAYKQRHDKSLNAEVKSSTSGDSSEGLLAICRGPMEQDCAKLNDTIKSWGTDESALNEVLLNRSNADLDAIKTQYQHMFEKSLDKDVLGALKGNVSELFKSVLSGRRADETSPTQPQQTENDVRILSRALEDKKPDELAIASTFTSRSSPQLRAIAQAYERQNNAPLEKVVDKAFSSHMRSALLYMLRDAVDRGRHDADLLEDAMKGRGTDDDKLVRRVVMIHWDAERLQRCKQAYQQVQKKSLAERIQGETKGDYERLMLACIGELR